MQISGAEMGSYVKTLKNSNLLIDCVSRFSSFRHHKEMTCRKLHLRTHNNAGEAREIRKGLTFIFFFIFHLWTVHCKDSCLGKTWGTF